MLDLAIYQFMGQVNDVIWVQLREECDNPGAQTYLCWIQCVREAPTKMLALLFGHCPFGGGSQPLPGWFGALI